MKPEHAFGDGQSPDGVTYATVAEQVRSLKPRALTHTNLDDVLTLIEFMQGECVRKHDANTLRSNELDMREKLLIRREQAVAIKQRAVNVALGGAPKRVGFWRR